MTVKATDDVMKVTARITGKALMEKIIVAAAAAVCCCVVGFVLFCGGVLFVLNSHHWLLCLKRTEFLEKDSILVTPK